jgi:hypothetical protein
VNASLYTTFALTASATYASGMDCVVVLTATSGPISLTFSAFSTEASFDFLYLQNGASTFSPSLASASGTQLVGTKVSSTGGTV